MDLKNTKNLIYNRTDSVNSYLNDIKNYPILTPDEEIDYYIKAKSGDKEARQMLINCNQRFVFAIAKRYATDEKLLDLVDEGNIGLITAIDSNKFDVTVGIRFLSFAVWYIRREILYYLINNKTLVKKTNSAKTNFHVSNIKNKFYCENGRLPSYDELIDIFNKEYGIKIQDYRDIYELKTESINTTYDGDESDVFENSYDFTSKTASYNDYENKIDLESNQEIINQLLKSLKPREAEIIKMSFGIGYDKQYTNSEIAFALDMTSERIRQIINTSIVKMHKYATVMEKEEI